MGMQSRADAINTENRIPSTHIIPFIKDNPVFDPGTTHSMSVAFDEVCAVLGTAEVNTREREVIATRIVELARRGERSADRLRNQVLDEAGSGNADRAEAIRNWRKSL